MAVMRLLRNAGSGGRQRTSSVELQTCRLFQYLATYSDTFSKFVLLQFLCGSFSGPEHALKTQETLHNCQS